MRFIPKASDRTPKPAKVAVAGSGTAIPPLIRSKFEKVKVEPPTAEPVAVSVAVKLDGVPGFAITKWAIQVPFPAV